MLTSLYPNPSDKDMLITAIILLSLCGVYFLKKFVNFLQAQCRILQGRTDVLNKYHIYFFMGETIKEQRKDIEEIMFYVNNATSDEEREALNFFLDVYQEVYQERLKNLEQGLKYQITNSNGFVLNACVYTQKFDDAKFYFQCFIIDDEEKIFKVKAKNGIKTENKNFKKVFKKYSFIKKAE